MTTPFTEEQAAKIARGIIEEIGLNCLTCGEKIENEPSAARELNSAHQIRTLTGTCWICKRLRISARSASDYEN